MFDPDHDADVHLAMTAGSIPYSMLRSRARRFTKICHELFFVMPTDSHSSLAIAADRIEQTIRLFRGERVILDADLATLYGVPTGALNRAVKRNRDRFPADFMFQLTKEEFENLKCQIGTSSWGGRRTLPYAFTASTAWRCYRVSSTAPGPCR